jgi:hypothetical protein
MDMKLLINRAFYIPSRRVAIRNLVLVVVLTSFAFLLHFLPFELGETVKEVVSPRNSLIVFVLASGLNFVNILNGIERYFLSKKQAIGPAIGMTVFSLLIYTAAWGAFQIGGGKQTFVLWTIGRWNLRETTNSFAAGGLLACLSTLGLTHLEFFRDDEAYDFGPFQKRCEEWKVLIGKRRKNNFVQEDHEKLLNVTRSMLDSLIARDGHVQPVAEAASVDMKCRLGTFLSRYEDDTRFVFTDFTGFPAGIDELLGEL